MVILSGHLIVERREDYLATCSDVVRRARRAPGSLDYAISPDLVEPGRVNLLEQWEDQAAMEAFRGTGVDEQQLSMIASATVAEYDVADSRPLS